MVNEPLAVRGVYHSFGPGLVLEDLWLTVAPGEFLAVVGPSGCGKSTLLNLLAGFLAPQAGKVQRHGHTRMVYQQDGLLPWLTAAENIAMAFGPGARAVDYVRPLEELLTLTQLQDFADYYPYQLSGGMRKRVELARVLAAPADVLLLDEPFAALDYLTRRRLHGELNRLLQVRPRAVVLVTHDIEEAALLADRVLVLSARPGRIRQEFRLTAPRPREMGQPEVLQTVRRILAELSLEPVAA
jgi:ABC-type nitrate/sulfonate/bicarbonate transport system ATPase subunit